MCIHGTRVPTIHLTLTQLTATLSILGVGANMVAITVTQLVESVAVCGLILPMTMP